MNLFINSRLMITALCLIAMTSIISAGVTSDLQATYLRCEYKVDPVIDSPNPRLSWLLNSKVKGQKQTAYRILVASSPEKLEPSKTDLWDSDKVPGDLTYQIRYEGVPLHSGQACYWKVMSWDKDGNPGQWSKTAKWEMGLLSKTDWKGKWIGLDLTKLGVGKVYHLPPAPFLRKDIDVKGKIKKARLYVSALGLYEFYINGKKIGNDYLTPGWTDYDKRVYYQTYDVTGNLQKGENTVGSILSYGWYSGYLGYAVQERYPKVRDSYGAVPALLAQIEVEYNDGSKETFVTGENWKANYGPIIETDILNGETYDAGKEFCNWCSSGYNDSNWKPVEIIPSTNRKIECYPGNPVQITQTITPVSVTQREGGKYIFDMGQNFAGVVRLKIKGNAGDTIVIRYGEMLYPDGSLMTENLRKARATDTYILKGGKTEEWTPSFTYHGFQYVEISGLKEKPEPGIITGLVLGSNTPEAGTFECSDNMVNRLYKNIVWTQRSNFVDIPTDCPQRDERLGWTGDAQVYVSSATLNMDIAAFYTKWLVDLNDAQMPSDAYPPFAPFPAILAHNNFSPGWMEAGIICPYQIYKSYDDTVVINKFWPNMTRFMSFLEKRGKGKFYFAEGSFEDVGPKGGYGDWLSIGKKTSPDMLATMYYGYCASLMSEMAAAAGKKDDARHYADVFAKVKKAFLEHYVGKDGMLKCDSAAYGNGDGYVDGDRGFTGHTQTAYANAIYMKILPDSLMQTAGKYLNQLIEKNNGYLTTGFLGVRPLLPALSATGHSETACRLLLNKDYPSWGYEVENGATTIWERWDSYTKGKGFQSAGMNSFSHYSFGSVCEWMFGNLAGIKTDGPAYKHIVIKPEVTAGKINFTDASLITMNGKIVSSWKVNDNRLMMDVVIPVNTNAEIYIPAADVNSVSEKGSDNKDFIKMYGGNYDNNYVKINVGSGEYKFESVIKR